MKGYDHVAGVRQPVRNRRCGQPALAIKALSIRQADRTLGRSLSLRLDAGGNKTVRYVFPAA